MGNSYTNKNYNRSNYDDLLYFNGFYDNLYREPFTNGFAFVFVTKPLLFLNPTKPTATKSYLKHLSYINMTRDQFFLQFLDSEKLNNNDTELVRMLSYDTSFRKTNFLPLFTNQLKSFDSQDITIDQTDAFETKQGFKYPIPTYTTSSEAMSTLSLSVYEDSNLDFTKMMTLWVKYIKNITDGTFNANPEMISQGALDYTSSIYYFVLAPDGRTLKYWCKYTGCWPTSIPYSAFKYQKKSAEITELDIQFVYTIKEDMDPRILEDFNRVSLMMDSSNYNVSTKTMSVDGYYESIKNSYLLNKSSLMASEEKAYIMNPDRSPLVFYVAGTSDGKNTDKTSDHFELDFGERGYKSERLDEIFERESDEKTSTGYFIN